MTEHPHGDDNSGERSVRFISRLQRLFVTLRLKNPKRNRGRFDLTWQKSEWTSGEKKLHHGKRAVWLYFAAFTLAGIGLTYFYVESKKYKGRYQQERAATQQLQGENRQLKKDYAAVQEANKALQEGPQGQAWKAREEVWGRKYTEVGRQKNTFERDAEQYKARVKELERKLAQQEQVPPAPVVAPQPTIKELDRMIQAYVRANGVADSHGIGVTIPGPGCQRALENLYDRLGEQMKTIKGLTKEAFVSFYENVARSKMKDCQQGNLFIWFQR